MTERKHNGDWSGSPRTKESESALLERILADMAFPATKEDITAILAVKAYSQSGGRAAELHDLVVQLDKPVFQDIDELEVAIKERHKWEGQHAPT